MVRENEGRQKPGEGNDKKRRKQTVDMERSEWEVAASEMQKKLDEWY